MLTSRVSSHELCPLMKYHSPLGICPLPNRASYRARLDDPIRHQDQAVGEFSSREIAYRPQRFFSGLLLKRPDDLIFVIDPARAPDLDKLVCEQGRNLRRGFAHLRHQQRLFQAADQSHCFRIGRVPTAHGPSHFSFASAVRTQRKSGDQPRAHFNRNDLKCGYFAASTCPAEEGRSQAPWRSKIACNSAIGTARGAQPRVAAKAAAAPAACPVSQHCGISRKKEWLDGSQEMCRPATSSPSMSRGTRQPYGTEISGNFGDSEGETPISSGRGMPSVQPSRVTRSTPTSRRAWRTPSCGADSIM